MIKRVVFDLSGVVFHWQPLIMLSELLPNRVQNEGQARFWAGKIFQSFHPLSDWALFDLGRIEPTVLANRIALRTGLTEDEILIVIEGIPQYLSPMDETVDLIKALHRNGVSLYFLSNMPASYADILLESNAFFACFSDGIFSAHVNQIKPERSIFESADTRFGGGGLDTLFIDDTLPNIYAARAHGWQAVHFRDPHQCRATFAAHGLL